MWNPVEMSYIFKSTLKRRAWEVTTGSVQQPGCVKGNITSEKIMQRTETSALPPEYKSNLNKPERRE